MGPTRPDWLPKVISEKPERGALLRAEQCSALRKFLLALTPIVLWICWEAGHALALAQAPAIPDASSAPRNSALPPAVPLVPESPIRYFRQLLALSPAALEDTLAGKPEAQRNALKAKLQEYALLPEDERENRLRVTELRWYLRPMMELAPTNRVPWLAAVPRDLRVLVTERLAQWDGLTTETRKEVLENDWIARYFYRYDSSTAAQREALLKQSSPERRARVEKEMARWQTLSSAQRQQMCSRFQQILRVAPGREGANAPQFFGSRSAPDGDNAADVRTTPARPAPSVR